MSGIFGVVHFDGAPVSPEELCGMHEAMTHWGPDALRSSTYSDAGFGQCLIYDTPEASHEDLPKLTADPPLVFTAEARIDNRDEVLDALGVPSVLRHSMADGEIARRAYVRWGEECPVRLLGDWSFAAWHPHERRLFLARDHCGNTALYYYKDRHRLAFASDRRALFALAGVPRRLDELYLAQVLAGWLGSEGERTIFQDIHRVAPGTAVTAREGALRSCRYWRLEDAPDVRLASPQEYAEGLRERMHHAVQARLRTAKPLAVALSAGLDSGAVAVIAGRQLAATGGTLVALTSVPKYQVTFGGDIANEFDLAAATVRAAGIVDHRALGAETISPFDGIERLLAIHDEPGMGAVNGYLLVDICVAARGHVLLTGQTGNGAFSWAGLPSLRDVTRNIREGHLRRAVTALLDVASRIPIASPGVRRWRHRGRGQSAEWDLGAINPAFAREIRLAARMAAVGYHPTAAATPRDGREGRLGILRPGRQTVGAIWAELGAAHDLVARDPTQDSRLIWFAHGIPNRLWRGPLNRWLTRESMKGLLPEEVRLSDRRGRQAADLVPRMAAHAWRLSELLDEVEASNEARWYVDLARLRAAARNISRSGTTNTWHQEASDVLAIGLSAALFITREARSASQDLTTDARLFPIVRRPNEPR